MSATVEYVYCVVPAALDTHDAPDGIDRSTVRSIIVDSVAALVGSLDASSYASEVVAERIGDPEWLAPRAVAHDALVTWASDRGPVVPFPMWVMFTDDSAVSVMLADRGKEFVATMDRVRGAREFCVRVSADRASLAAAAEQMDSALAALEQQASVASPGEAYLLRRKLEEARKAATRDAAVRIADRTHDALSEESRASVIRATTGSREQGILLDGAYLVANENYEAFRTVLTALIGTFQPAGLRFDFTGPWPPYHFVREN